MSVQKTLDYFAREYVDASDNVDDYDLHRENPKEVEEFEKLQKEEEEAKKALIKFVFETFEKPT